MKAERISIKQPKTMLTFGSKMFLFLCLCCVAVFGMMLWSENLLFNELNGSVTPSSQFSGEIPSISRSPGDISGKPKSRVQSEEKLLLPQPVEDIAIPQKLVATMPSSVSPSNSNTAAKINTTLMKWKDIAIYRNISICPELLAAAHHVVSNQNNKEKNYNILMVQSVGHYRNANGRPMRHDPLPSRKKIFQSNQMILKQRSIDSIALDRRPDDTSGLLPPNFWKFDFILDHCAGRDLIWYLDGDMIIQNATVLIDTLWEYHSHYAKLAGANDLDILFSRQTHPGSNFIINCKSSSALDFYSGWKSLSTELAIEQNWDSLPKSHSWIIEHALQEAEALNKMLASLNQTNSYYSTKPGIYSTTTPCPLVTNRLDLECNLPEFGWYQSGQFVVHIGRNINPPARRSDLLLEAIPTIDTKKIDSLDLYQSAELYIKKHAERGTTVLQQEFNKSITRCQPKSRQKIQKGNHPIR